MDTPPKIRRLIFSREMCFGTCPAYTVSLEADGQVSWSGVAYVKVSGQAGWSISSDQVAEIEETLHHVRFRHFANDYDNEDAPTCQASSAIAVDYADGCTKTVNHYHGNSYAPERLTLLEDCLDDLLGTAPYIGSGEPTDIDW